MAWSGLEPALFSTLDHRSDALPSALLRRYEVLDITELNIGSGYLLNVAVPCENEAASYLYNIFNN